MRWDGWEMDVIEGLAAEYEIKGVGKAKERIQISAPV